MTDLHQKSTGDSSKTTHEGGYSLLVVDGSPGHAQMVRMMLASMVYPKFNVESTTKLSDALEFCSKQRFEGCILDLDLPDSKGIDTLIHLSKAQPELAIVVIASPLEESLGALLIKYGAQDEIAQDGLSAEALARTVAYSIERKRSLEHRRKAASSKEVDELKQALQQSRETFTAFFRSILGVVANRTMLQPPGMPALSMAMIMVDEAGTVQQISDCAGKLFALDIEKSVGKPINDVLQFGKEKQVMEFLQARKQTSFPLQSVVACQPGAERKFVSTQISPFENGAILLFIDQTPLVVSLSGIRSELISLIPE
ncbi:MAG TPA: response regulator [Candidatus Obscuribacterales bacterium]